MIKSALQKQNFSEVRTRNNIQTNKLSGHRVSSQTAVWGICLSRQQGINLLCFPQWRKKPSFKLLLQKTSLNCFTQLERDIAAAQQASTSSKMPTKVARKRVTKRKPAASSHASAPDPSATATDGNLQATVSH